jgi:hypothetical protein
MEVDEELDDAELDDGNQSDGEKPDLRSIEQPADSINSR